MSRRFVYSITAVLALIAIIVGCATAPKRELALSGMNPNKGFIDQTELGVNPNHPAGPAPTNADDSVLLPPQFDGPAAKGIRQQLESGGSIELRNQTALPPASASDGSELVIVEKRPDLTVRNPSSTLSIRGTKVTFSDKPSDDKPATPSPTTQLGTGLRGAGLQKAQQQEREVIAAPADIPGSGALIAKLPGEKNVPIPLKHTDVKASILGYISTVDVSQQYQNPYDQKIEAVYVFPLPTDAAVSDFVLVVGDRKIRGIIREKAEAQRIYSEAKRQGYVASLMTQDRPNIFTQAVANIEPGKQIDVNIRYFNTLQYVDGWYEFVFPMVVGPRFNPPGSTEGIGAKAHGSAVGTSGQTKEIEYLHPSERSGHDIALSVEINAGVKIERLDSINHRIASKSNETGAHVELTSDDTIPNKDFVLRYKIAGDTLKSALITQRDERGGFFTLMLYPPQSLKDIPRTPVEMVFTLDVSGSMSGKPIEQSRAAIQYALTHMRPDDTFQIIRFASSTEMMSPTPVSATQENVAAALQYIQQMSAGGGTMMLDGIKQSLGFRRDESRLRYITFLTDGYIGNETDILSEIRKSRGDARLFSFGVGSSPNRYLLDGMARLGAGTAAYLSLNDDANKVMEQYFERISHPAMSDIAVDFGAMSATDVFPKKIPDLFVGRPVIVTGRFKGEAPETIRIRGKVGGEAHEVVVKTNPSDAGGKNALPAVWARAKISDLSDSVLDSPRDLAANELPLQIRHVALEFGLISAYTSFVAVDSSQVTAGDQGTTVNVPVPVPDGVRYDTTVTEHGVEAVKEVRGVE